MKDDAPKPEVTAAKQPSVRLTARTTRSTATRQASGQSSVELLTQARKGLVLQTEPVATQIWAQIGAFHSETNAQNMLEKMKSLSEGRISEGQKDGKRLYRSPAGAGIRQYRAQMRCYGARFSRDIMAPISLLTSIKFTICW